MPRVGMYKDASRHIKYNAQAELVLSDHQSESSTHKACNQQVREDQEHVTQCEGYEDLRREKDLANEEDLVQFFTKVMKRRHEMNWD